MKNELATFEGASDISLMFPIVGSQIKRLGWLRVIPGGLSMYLCIPFLVIFHFSTAVFFYQWLFRPLFGTQRVRWSDHVILDRHRIEGIPRFDRFNCLFCGYANGLCTMVNTEIDQISALRGPRGLLGTLGVALAALIQLPFMIFAELSLQIIYNILVSRPLGMHRVSIAEARQVIKDDDYAGRMPTWLRTFVRAYKNTWLRFSMALEQIESSWCPLKHFERREGIVYPDHHRKFFGPDEIDAMRETLSTAGTVSSRTPKC